MKEDFVVGADTGTPVDDGHYQVPFKLTGKLNKLTLPICRSISIRGSGESNDL